MRARSRPGRGDRRARLPLAAAAQQRALTLDDLYDPQKRVDFVGTVPMRASRGSTTTHYLQMRSGRGQDQPGWVKVEAATGPPRRSSTPRSSRPRSPALAGVSADDAKRLAGRRSLLSTRRGPTRR